MNYLEIFNSVAIGLLAISYFTQNRSLKFLKEVNSSYDPKKLKEQSDIVLEAHKAKLDLMHQKRIKEDSSILIQKLAKSESEILESYEEMINSAVHFLKEQSHEKREQFYKVHPKNAEKLRQFLHEIDTGRMQPKPKRNQG